jgi:hypothetical protein
VFVQHPYDKGDLIILPSEQKDLKLVVTQIYLMHTSFEPVEKGKDIHIPHSKLSSDYIENWSRLAQADPSPVSVVLHLDPKSTLPNLQEMWELQADVTKYVQDHPSRFYKSPELTRVPIKEEDLMESGINVEFKTKRKVCHVILRPIHLLAKLRRSLGNSITTIKISEIKYCVTFVVDCRRRNSHSSHSKKASLLLWKISL